ncbi:MAG: Glucose dehydrogenase [Caulobacter sp.]|nr:Glucose dehydrogenase [Caulobacter sp.]
MKTSLIVLTLTALAACNAPPSAAKTNADARGVPVQARKPNGEGQKPALADQTRAPMRTAGVVFEVKTVAEGLENPWGLAFLPDGRLLVSERPGRLRIVGRDGTLSAPLAGVPKVEAQGQGGLLDVALAPDFATSHRVFLTFLERRAGGAGGAGIAVARGVLGDTALSEVKIIFRAQPGFDDDKNVGSRLAFAPDGTLFVTVGDRFSAKEQAQALNSDLGKLVRITQDGAPAPGNPFIGKAGARPEIWSYGHRNPEAAAIQPGTGRLWTIEHGPKGGDEINIPAAGKNYGWPVITYGIDYNGQPIGAGITAKEGMQQPLYYWDPVIAPSGMAFYDAALFPAWKGSLFVGSLKEKHLARLTLDGDRVVGEERLLTDLDERIRDVRVGPDGAIYVLTDNEHGRVLKLVPKG